MDVYEHENVADNSANSSVPIVSTPETKKFNDELNNLPGDPTNNRDMMRERITYFVLFLLFLIVLYGLFMQNYWLIGTVCFPVIACGVYKIFDRYL
jgi:hypothetical protein